MYDLGVGLQKDYEQAARRYRVAAAQGSPMGRAQFTLGRLCCSKDVDEYAQVCFWLSLVARGYEPEREGNRAGAARDIAAEGLELHGIPALRDQMGEWKPTPGMPKA